MKKTTILNSEISYTIAQMGHGDKLVIADAGLPIHDFTPRIDLALKQDIPTFLDVFETVIKELQVEEMILAKEIKKHNHKIFDELQAFCKANNVKMTFVSHEDFKEATIDSKAVIRSGECSPYANVILKSGVTF